MAMTKDALASMNQYSGLRASIEPLLGASDNHETKRVLHDCASFTAHGLIPP
jgi:hypothetical protein